MERIESLINKLKEQFEQNADSTLMLGTAQLLQFELTKLKTNEAITVKLKISGTGNLKLIGTPKVEFPAGFELFDPKVSDNINTTANNTSGTKTIEYIAIPRSAGTSALQDQVFRGLP